MGYSRQKGPVYGAKAQLASWAATGATSTGASSALIASWVVPVYEDWFITELSGYGSTMSSLGNTVTFKSEGGSTSAAGRDWGDGSNSTKAQTIGTITWGGSTTGPVLTTVTASPGEDEGKWVPGGSTIRAVLSVAANAITGLNLTMRGYTRFIDSTRVG